MSIVRVIKKFRSILSHHQKFRIFELAIIMIVGGFFEMFSVSLVIPFMNAVMDTDELMETWYAKLICDTLHIQSARTLLIVMAVFLASVYIIKNLYLLFQYSIQYKFVYGNMFEMQRTLLDKYIHRPYEFFLKINSGEIIRIINNDTNNTFELLSQLLIMFSEIVVSGMLIAAVFIITPFATICIAVVMLLLLLLINAVIKPILQRAGRNNQDAAVGMNQWLLQSVQGIKEIKVAEKEAFFQKQFDVHGFSFVKTMRRHNVLAMIPRFSIEAFSMGTMFVIVAVMLYVGIGFETVIPILTAVAMAAMRLLPSVNRISVALAEVSFREPMLDKLIENVRGLPGTEGKTEIDSGNCIEHVASDIHFRDVLFHYPNTKKNIFSEASMMINKGETIGIVGSSGAGKTTAIDILLGLLAPQKGQILVDGIDIAEDMHGWHRQIGYIPQSIFMLDDTIRHNVCFGVDEKDISEARLRKALEEASLAELVESLPNGVNTEIGERGVRLSGGQRQRIGIARALYQNPEVLVFDEATSALDNETESEIMDSIHSLHGQKTMIIIAHRLSTIKACDHIYRVEEGKITKKR